MRETEAALDKEAAGTGEILECEAGRVMGGRSQRQPGFLSGLLDASRFAPHAGSGKRTGSGEGAQENRGMRELHRH